MVSTRSKTILKKNQKTGLDRNTIDKFYTKPSIVQEIKDWVEILNIDYNHDLIIEPSAGNGSFIPLIKEMTLNYKFYDLEPEHESIQKQDYLLLELVNDNFKRIHVIGNPPFGRQASLAIKFIKKSCQYADTVSFILPKSFKKDSMKKHFPMNFHQIFESNIPSNSFLVNNIECNVPSVFQIWEKRDYNRSEIIKLKPNGYTFITKDKNPDISFRRVGVYAGNIDTVIHDKNPQSHYFITFQNLSEELLIKLKNIKFETDNTVGPRSISKQELIKEFNKYF